MKETVPIQTNALKCEYQTDSHPILRCTEFATACIITVIITPDIGEVRTYDYLCAAHATDF